MKDDQKTTTDKPADQNFPVTTTDNLPTTNAGSSVQMTSMADLTKAVEDGKALGDVKKLEVGTINLKSEYLSFEKVGESIRRVFLGFTMRMSVDPVTGEEKGLTPAVQLYDPATETINVCQQTVLVGVLYEIGYPKGAAIQITYKGDRKNSKGLKYQDFDIRALISKKK